MDWFRVYNFRRNSFSKASQKVSLHSKVSKGYSPWSRHQDNVHILYDLLHQSSNYILHAVKPSSAAEIHIQMNTRTKAFCADDATFSNDPNTQPVSSRWLIGHFAKTQYKANRFRRSWV